MKLAQLVKDHRIQQSISVRDLAKDIGISHTVLFRFENSKRTGGLSFSALLKILTWLFK